MPQGIRMRKNAASGRGGLLCLAVVLASSAAFPLAFAPAAGAYEFGEPEVRPVGSAETVFDWSRDACDVEDIPDTPARAFRDSLGRVQLLASHASVRRKVGPDLNSVQHQCAIVFDSHGNRDPAAFDDKEWINSLYTPDGRTIYGLTSIEYQGWNYDAECAGWAGTVEQNKCWYNAIGLVASTNSGASYSHAPAPAHRVASSPYRYAPGNGPLGIFEPSNIIHKPSDGYYYAIVRAEPHQAQQRGACLMRTRTLDDTTSWRAWDGSGFGVRFINPYVEQTATPQAHVCQVLSPGALDPGLGTGTLTYSTYLDKYLLLGVSQRYDQVAKRWNGGFYYSTSDDLIHWSPQRILMKGQLPWTHRCTDPDPNPVRDPALLDPTSSARNFDSIGRRAYLYFTRFNFEYWDANTCWGTLDRDLVRIQIEFNVDNQPPGASFSASPNPALTGEAVTFDGSGSSDADGSIRKYEWDLDGDGAFETDTGSSATATRSYVTAANVAVNLRVTDNRGATGNASRTVTVTNRGPTASFTALPNPAVAGEIVSFDGSASSDPDGTLANYTWDLDGDGSFETDSGSSPRTTRSYPAAASITVKLRVTDSNGDSGDAIRLLTVDPPPPANELPTASFSASPSPVPTGENVLFDGSASTDPDGAIARYEWDLDGDGAFETDTGTTATTTRSYAAAATIAVRLRVTDGKGATNDAIRTLAVTNRDPTASFTASPNPAIAGQIVSFDGSASSDPDGTITRYEWDLDGDGAFETDAGGTATTTKSYPAMVSGVTVGLRVTDNDAADAATTRTLTVNPSPVTPSFPPGPAHVPGPLGPLAGPPLPTVVKCAPRRGERARVVSMLRNAHRKLARARTARAKRRYRRVIRRLDKRLKRLQSAGCTS
jgi:YD repeat-containing protein